MPSVFALSASRLGLSAICFQKSQSDPFLPFKITPQITGGKKQSDEETALFSVRVHLHC